MLWSSCQSLNDVFGDSFAPANVQVAQDDFNLDGKPDMITLTANIQSSFPVQGIRALIQFNYQYTVRLTLSPYAISCCPQPVLL